MIPWIVHYQVVHQGINGGKGKWLKLGWPWPPHYISNSQRSQLLKKNFLILFPFLLMLQPFVDNCRVSIRANFPRHEFFLDLFLFPPFCLFWNRFFAEDSRGCGAKIQCKIFSKAKTHNFKCCHFIICRYPRPFQVSQILRPSQGPNEDHIDPTSLQDHVSCRSVAKRDAGIGCWKMPSWKKIDPIAGTYPN